MSVVNLQKLAFEVILVNDGSSDNSGNLCDKFADKYGNIKALHKFNGGVVSARNAGLRAAEGKYVTFLDADDWIRAEFLTVAVEKLKDKTGIDIVAGCMLRALGNGELKGIFPRDREECVFERVEAREALFRREYFGWELCGKVYKKALFDGWKSDETIKICEDLAASWELFGRAIKVLHLPMDFYYYYWNETSATNEYNYLESKSYLVFERILNSYEDISSYIKDVLLDNYIKRLINAIRESYYQNKSREEIEIYQQKLNAACSMAQVNCVQNVKAMCHGYYDTLNYLNEFRECIAGKFQEIYNENRRVYYWGTGVVADYVSRIAFRMGFDCCGYIVSEGELRKTSFRGKKVLYLSEMEVKRADAVILLVKKESQEVIFKNLQDKGYHNVFKIDTMGVV